MFDCMYTLFLPAPYTYLTLPYLLHSIDRVCVLWILHFFSLPFFAYVEDKNNPKFFKWNTNHEICFLFFDLLLGKTV